MWTFRLSVAVVLSFSPEPNRRYSMPTGVESVDQCQPCRQRLYEYRRSEIGEVLHRLSTGTSVLLLRCRTVEPGVVCSRVWQHHVVSVFFSETVGPATSKMITLN